MRALVSHSWVNRLESRPLRWTRLRGRLSKLIKPEGDQKSGHSFDVPSSYHMLHSPTVATISSFLASPFWPLLYPFSYSSQVSRYRGTLQLVWLFGVSLLFNRLAELHRFTETRGEKSHRDRSVVEITRIIDASEKQNIKRWNETLWLCIMAMCVCV